MQAFNINRNIYYSILLTTFLFVISYAFLNVSYIESDDLEMLKIAKGYYSLSPDEHLIFINVIVGFVCKILYKITFNIEWYSVIMIFLQFFSMSFILYVLFRNRSKKLLIILVSITFFYLIINIQFTLVSMLLGLAGILGIMNINERERFISYIFPFLLLFFSSLIRFEAFCLVFVVGSMYVLLNKIALLKSPIFLKACTLLFFFIAFSIWINKLSYSSPDWSVYSKYNQMRGKINDNPNLSPNNISQIEKKLSVSNLEINLFNSFVYTQSFNEEKLVNIANEVSHPVDMKMYIGHVYYWLRYYKYAIVLVLITLLISRRMFITNLLPIASLLLIFLIICYNHLPKDRIMMMLFFEVILFTLFINNFSNRLSYLICLLGIIWMADNYQKGVNNIYRNCKNDYLQLDPTKTYIPLFPIEYAYPNDIHPFDTRKYTEINMIAAGWLTNSPFQKFQLSALKLNTTIPISVLDLNTEKSNVVYLGKMNRENQTGLINSYLSTKNKKLKLTETKSNFCLYSIQKNVENN